MRQGRVRRTPGKRRSALSRAVQSLVAFGLFTTGEHVFRASSCAADEATPAVAVTFDAPSGCPSVETFVLRTRARARLRVVSSRESKRAFFIAIAPTERGFLGTLRESTDEEPQRILAPTCDELVSALAFTLALTIDPLAASAEPPLLPPMATSAPIPAATSPLPAPSTKPETSPPLRVRLEAGADVEGGWGAAISGPRVGVALQWPRRIVALETRLAFSYGGALDPPDVARLDLLRARLDAGLTFPIGARWALGPRAGMDLGALLAQGRALDDPRSTVLPWIAPRLGAFLRMDVVAHLGVELAGALVFPLARPVLSRGAPEGIVLDGSSIGAGVEASLFFLPP